MGDMDSNPNSPSLNMSLNRKSGTQLALALTVLALILSANSIINQSWVSTNAEDDGISVESNFGLTELNAEACVGENCTTLSETYADLYSDCRDDLKSEFNNPTSSQIEESCGEIEEFHNAGFIAKIMLAISCVVLLYAVILQVKSMLGNDTRKPNFMSGIGGFLVGISVLVWYLMLPEPSEGNDLEWSQGVWMNLIALSLALVASQSKTIQSWIDGPPRMRANGVRAGQDMEEFVLKESSCGDKTLSILVDDQLVRVVNVERIGSSPHVKDILATSRDSYTGFSHQRLDWLDDFKGVWWIVSGASLISIVMISPLFSIPLVLFGALALAQLMDPERFVISTTSGNHSFVVNRWRSNRELTNLAMDLVDECMLSVLRGNSLDSSHLENRASLIAERFAKDRESSRLKVAENNLGKIAKQEEKARIKMEKAAAKAKIKEAEEKAAAAEAKAIAAEKEAQEKLAQMEKEIEEQKAKISETEPPQEENKPGLEETPQTQPESGTETQTTVDEKPEPPATQLPTPPPPQVEQKPTPPVATPQVEKIPEPATPPPQQAVFIPPPPALPPLPSAGMAPPPLPGIMPPPPQVTTNMPPPPQSVASIPPPPQVATNMPPPPQSVASIPPPPVVVAAAPREENLSDDEKDDLLGELNS